jgi:ornithine carbamoyltransferase
MGDLAFVHHVRWDVSGLTVMFVGVATNLLRSWCEAAAVLGLTIIHVCPSGYEVDPAWLRSLSPDLPDRVIISRCPEEVIASADIIYTDCWPAADAESDRGPIDALFAPLQVTAALLAKADPRALFLPCPPVTRDEEVSADAMDDKRCRVVEAKGWLLDAQAALLAVMVTPTR